MHETKALASIALTTVCLLSACASGDEARHDEPPQATAAQVAPAPGDRLAAALAEYAAANPCDSEGTCWLNPLPRGYALRAIAGTGANDVWFAGEGDALHFDGEKVRGYPTGLGRVTALWSASPTDVWAVGLWGVARFDGTKFTRVMPATPDAVHARDIWATGPDNVYVAIHSGISHWDGRSWTLHNGVTGGVIAGSGPDDIWVGGGNTGWHYDGKVWSEVPELASVMDVLVRAPNDVWTIGMQPRFDVLQHFDGTGWTRQEVRPPGYSRLAQIDGHLWAIGVRMSRYEGTSWTHAAVSAAAISVLGDTLLAVDDYGRILRVTRTGLPVATNLTVSVHDGSLYDAWASSGTDAWAVGTGGIALHYDGTRTRTVETGVRENLYDVEGAAHDDVWAVGSGGAIVHWDGARWTRVEGQTKSFIETVFPVARNEAWIGGRDAVLLHATVAGATRVALEGLPDRAAIADIRGVAADDIWVAGSGGADGAIGFLAHFDGTTWSPVFIPKQVGVDARALTRITAHASNDVWIEARRTGKPTLEYSWHWDGTRWTAVWNIPDGPRLTQADFATHPSAQDAVDGKVFEVGLNGRFTYRFVKP